METARQHFLSLDPKTDTCLQAFSDEGANTGCNGDATLRSVFNFWKDQVPQRKPHTYHFQWLTHTERLLTLQSDEKTWPDKQKDNGRDIYRAPWHDKTRQLRNSIYTQDNHNNLTINWSAFVMFVMFLGSIYGEITPHFTFLLHWISNNYLSEQFWDDCPRI